MKKELNTVPSHINKLIENDKDSESNQFKTKISRHNLIELETVSY